MRFVKYTVAGILVAFGALFLAAGTYALFDEDSPGTSAFVGCLILGVPPFAGGIWLYSATQKQSHNTQQSLLQAENKRRRDILYELIQAKEGKFTLLDFAIAADLPGDEARTFLQDQAKAFGADYSVTEKGDIVYHFWQG